MMRFISGKIGLLLILLLGVSAVSAQSSWKVVDAQSVSDATGAGQELRNEAMSPDGSTLAWIQGNQLCLYTFADDNKNCVFTPETFAGVGQYSHLSWSPDGKTLVFTEDLFVMVLDGDVWTYDVESSTFDDHTDDQFSGSFLNHPESKALLDYLPTWNPANGDLYFFRSLPPINSGTMALELLTLDGSEPKQVRDLSADLPALSVNRSAAISPDGTQMAMSVLGNDLEDPKNGVWVVSLKDGTPTQVLTIDQFNAGLPDWAIHVGDFPEIVQWSGNDALVVWALNEAFITNAIPAAYYVDLTAKSVTPLADFTDSPDAKTYALGAKGDTIQPVYRSPRTGIVTPDGSAYIYLSYAFGDKQAYVWSEALPPDGNGATQIGVIDPFKNSAAANWQPAISADGTHALLYGYWLTLQPPGA